MKVTRRWALGRAADNDIVIHNTSVSNHHAELLEIEGGRLVLRDLGSTNGTFVGSTGRRVQEQELQGDEVLFFSSHYSVPLVLLRQRLQGGGSFQAEQPHLVSKDLIRIGRDPANDIRLRPLTVSRFHAEVRRIDGGKGILRDLGTKLGTLVNGCVLKGAELEIGPEDEIEIGGYRVSLSFGGAEDGGRCAVDHRGFILRVEELCFSTPGPKGRLLIDHVSLAVYPGELVALMGPSGCGKSTLLNLLTGECEGSSGRITYDGVDLGRNPGAILPYVAHVPQDDFLNPDLTVRESLRCYARLRLPADVGDEEIVCKIDEVCRKLGLLDEAKGIDLRDRLVGSAERKGLSGGQRKRVSMAMELLSDPRILFLDEPTSGLSSYDTRIVIEQLSKLSHVNGLAVVVTIHQPSLQVFRMFNSVVYLKSGKLLYYGPSYPDSVSYFCPKQDPESVGPDGVMEALDSVDPERLSQSYRDSVFAKKYVQQRLLDRGGAGVAAGGSVPRRIGAPLTQFAAVAGRDLKVRLRDRQALMLLLAQPLLIGLLIGQLFAAGGRMDHVAVSFLSALVCYWLGLNGTIRELVSERCLMKRERRGGLSIWAYLSAKLVVAMLMNVGQIVLYLLLVGLQVAQLPLFSPMALAAGLISALVGASTGLAVSASARTQVGAMAVVPLLLIPIILLGGYIKPYDLDLSGLAVARMAADCMPVRWSFEAFSAVWDAAGPCFANPHWLSAIIVQALMCPLLMAVALWRTLKA